MGGRTSEEIVWEDPPCPVCGIRQATAVLTIVRAEAELFSKRLEVVRCGVRGLCYTTPRPIAACLPALYRSDYGPHQNCGLAPARRVRAGWRRRMPEFWRARHPTGRGLPWHGQGRLLDFGCGNGAFLELMHLQGWQVVGLDFSETMVRRIREELGLPALVGTLPHPELEPRQFDVVTMWHVLEHVPQPLEVLRGAYDVLVSGGRLVVGVPNLDSAPARWFGTAWIGWDVPRHLSHFSPTTLRSTVERAGYVVERVRMLRSSAWLCQSAEQALREGHRAMACLRHRWVARLVASYLCWSDQSDSIMLTARKP